MGCVEPVMVTLCFNSGVTYNKIILPLYDMTWRSFAVTWRYEYICFFAVTWRSFFANPITNCPWKCRFPLEWELRKFSINFVSFNCSTGFNRTLISPGWKSLLDVWFRPHGFSSQHQSWRRRISRIQVWRALANCLWWKDGIDQFALWASCTLATSSRNFSRRGSPHHLIMISLSQVFWINP